VKNIRISIILVVFTVACGSSSGSTDLGAQLDPGTSVDPGQTTGDCLETLPQKTEYAGEYVKQVTIIYDPATHAVTLHEGYQAPDTIVVDKNDDGSYLVTTGPGWAVTNTSHGEIVNHDTWYEWKDAPIDTELTAEMKDADDHTVTIKFRYDSTGVELTSVCW